MGASGTGQTTTFTTNITTGPNGAGLFGSVPNQANNPTEVFSGSITLGGTMWMQNSDGGINGATTTSNLNDLTMNVTGGISITRTPGSQRMLYNNVPSQMNTNFSGNIVDAAGTTSPLPLILYTEGGNLTDGGDNINQNLILSGTNNTYAGGTVIDETGAGFQRGGQLNTGAGIQVGATSRLGNGNVTVLPGGWLTVANASAVAPGKSILLTGNGSLQPVLNLTGSFDPSTIINPASSDFVIAIQNYDTDTASMNLSGFAGPVIISKGEAYGGQYGTSAYTGASITPPQDNTYRFANNQGGFTPQQNAFTVSTNLNNVGSTAENVEVTTLQTNAGSDAVDLTGTSNFTGTVTVDNYGRLNASGTLGSASGAVNLNDGALVAAAGTITKGVVTFNSRGILGASGSSASHVTMSVSNLVRGGYANYGGNPLDDGTLVIESDNNTGLSVNGTSNLGVTDFVHVSTTLPVYHSPTQITLAPRAASSLAVHRGQSVRCCPYLRRQLQPLHWPWFDVRHPDRRQYHRPHRL